MILNFHAVPTNGLMKKCRWRHVPWASRLGLDNGYAMEGDRRLE